jgi:hypothetical protein
VERFQDILNKLSVIIHTPLYSDKKRAVRLTINQKLHIQIEDEEPNDRILLATFVAEIPPGRYRENLLKEGLKSNALPVRHGTFAYSERNNQLALFEYVPYDNLTGEKLADRLAVFIEKALHWKQAIENGTLPSGLEPEPKVDHFVFGRT